jgi:hypothetical protein
MPMHSAAASRFRPAGFALPKTPKNCVSRKDAKGAKEKDRQSFLCVLGVLAG